MRNALRISTLTFAPLLVLSLMSDRVMAAERDTPRLTDLGETRELSMTSPEIRRQETSMLDTGDSRLDLIWDNGWDYYDLITAQQESDSAGVDSEVADDFSFSYHRLIETIWWTGGYFYGPPDDGDFDWIIRFYYDDGSWSKPGELITSYYFPNSAVNELLRYSPSVYQYSVNLPVPVPITADEKYWISFQGVGDIPPQSGMGFHTSTTMHGAVLRSDFFGNPDWTDFFYLIGTEGDLVFFLLGRDGMCEWNPGNSYKMHYPQLPENPGWTIPVEDIILADDWLCTESGPIKDIHFWGAYKSDNIVPFADVMLRIRADIPAGTGGIPYSRPGAVLWSHLYGYDDFEVLELVLESREIWYDPVISWIYYSDHMAYFQYNLCLPEIHWFYQNEGTVYWLQVQAYDSGSFGLETSVNHWNDNAVWWDGAQWQELIEPFTLLPFDLAFVITNGETNFCYMNVGEADGSGAIDIDDVVYLIAFIFSGGNTPVPYSTASGDADCSCAVDIDDVVYLITHIFQSGPAPCNCDEWVWDCGNIR